MPPSGYSQPAVNGLVTFFATTLADLRAEVADGKHANLETGCTFEVDQIEKVLASKPNIDAGTELHSVASASVGAQLAYTWLILAMTLTFYRRVLAVGVDIALTEMNSEVSAIHIDEAGQLTAR